VRTAWSRRNEAAVPQKCVSSSLFPFFLFFFRAVYHTTPYSSFDGLCTTGPSPLFHYYTTLPHTSCFPPSLAPSPHTRARLHCPFIRPPTPFPRPRSPAHIISHRASVLAFPRFRSTPLSPLFSLLPPLLPVGVRPLPLPLPELGEVGVGRRNGGGMWSGAASRARSGGGGDARGSKTRGAHVCAVAVARVAARPGPDQDPTLRSEGVDAWCMARRHSSTASLRRWGAGTRRC
jgi:hypothetical protein